MEGQRRRCNSCGHDCHCYAPDCDQCYNDVCITCECGRIEYQDLPESFIKENT